MKEIKTKPVIKDIKLLDKTTDVSRRAKNAYIRSKEQPEQSDCKETGDYVGDAAVKVRKSVECVVRKAGYATLNHAQKTSARVKERSLQNSGAPYPGTSQGEYAKTPPNNIKRTVHRNISYSAGNHKIEPTRDVAKITMKRKIILVKPSEMGKRRFIQSRASQRFGQLVETGVPNPITMQAQDAHSFRESAHLFKQSANTVSIAAEEKRRGAIKTAARSVKKLNHTAKPAIKTSQGAAKSVVKSAHASQKAAQAAARAAAVSTKTASKVAAAFKAAITTIKGLISLLAAGGWTVVTVILVICLAGLLLGSPFGIFFSNEKSDTNTPVMTEAVNRLNQEFAAKLEQIQEGNPYDRLDLSNNGSSAIVGNWRDILAVYAVKVSANPENGMDVATLNNTKMGIMRDTFWDMNRIEYWTERIGRGEDTTETILHIKVESKSYSDMITPYRFDTRQVSLLNELMQEQYRTPFMRLTGSYTDITLSPSEIAAIMQNLPANLDERRKNVAMAAYSLVGKVNYFWGGKSTIIGWDSRWGTPAKVTDEGSSTTGTMRPFGLDCSGYVAWVFASAVGRADGAEKIGYGTASQYAACTPVSWNQAQPGDLAFYSDLSHVGIVVGIKNGHLLIANCTAGQNSVVVSSVTGTNLSGFCIIGEP